MAGGDPGDLDHTGAVGVLGAEGGVVVVLDGLVGVAHRNVSVADHGGQRHGPLGDRSGEPPAAHLDRVAAEELRQVRGVAADVGERAGSRAPL